MFRKLTLLFFMAFVVFLSIFFVFKANGGIKPEAVPLLRDEGCTGIGNPAYEYCTNIMGYAYQEVTDQDGKQDGVCIMPDDTICPQWDFYSGECGSEFSYCVQNGMHLETRNEGKDPFNDRYSICVNNRGNYLGNFWSLSGLLNINLDPNEYYPPYVPNPPTIPDDTGLVIEVPPGFNWRDHAGFNWVTPVKNQLSCGSCWAFSAVGAAETQKNIEANNPHLDLDLSEQYLVSDCFPLGNCSGGSEYLALYQIFKTGIPDEECYPYLNKNSSCDKRCSDYNDRLEHVQFASFLDEPNYSEQDIKIIVSNTGPVVIAYGIYKNNIGAYWDGDIYRCRRDYVDGGTKSVDHGGVVVGYNDEGGYWIVKNSWGSSWNGDGFLKLGYNECNIAHSRISWAGYSPPKEIIVSDINVPEGRHFNTFVGDLISDDLDMDDSHTYNLVEGEGDDDNDSFKIIGNKLHAVGRFDRSVKDKLSIRIRSTDSGGQYLEEMIAMIVVEADPFTEVFIPMLMLSE